MTISSHFDQQNGFIEVVFDASPVVADYQEHFPEVIRILDEEHISRMLIRTDFTESSNDASDAEFTKFVFADLNRRLSHLAVVCPENLRKPVQEVIAPIITQGKHVSFFTSRDDAVEWLAVGT